MHYLRFCLYLFVMSFFFRVIICMLRLFMFLCIGNIAIFTCVPLFKYVWAFGICCTIWFQLLELTPRSRSKVEYTKEDIIQLCWVVCACVCLLKLCV